VSAASPVPSAQQGPLWQPKRLKCPDDLGLEKVSGNGELGAFREPAAKHGSHSLRGVHQVSSECQAKSPARLRTLTGGGGYFGV
jgi:hypothetical protein